MTNWFYRHVVIPAYESGIKRRRTFSYWRDLERSQWHATSELQTDQIVALRNLLEHAASNCPYYREAWGELGLSPQQIVSLENFERWPLVDRTTVRQHRGSMRSSKSDERLIPKSTGGSSGVPLQFDLNQDSNDRRMAAWHRGYAWAGAEPGTRQVYLWGIPLGDHPWHFHWKDHLYTRWLYRRHVLNTFRLSDETMPDYLCRLNRFRPDVLVAYTNPLYWFARWIEERKLVPFSPRSIVVGAERLHSFQRELIERVFQAPVFETYGSREFMLIGAECERHSGLHLTMENLLVEILDDDGRPAPDGEEGQIAVTDLYNYGMPFIRYLTGDRAIAGFEACACGRGLLTLQKLIGRQLDLLTLANGRRVPGELFPHLIKDYAPVRRFQVVQEQPSLVLLKLVVGEGWSAECRSRLVREIRRELGEEIRLEIAEVADIPLTPAGKLQVVVNRCAARHESRVATTR